MDVSEETPRESLATAGWGARFLVLLLGAMLLGFGAIIAGVGVGAVSRQAYDLPWEASHGIFIGFGLMQAHSSGVVHYRGFDAAWIGLGLVSFGLMLAIWGLAVLRRVFRKHPRPSQAETPHGIGFVGSVASLATLGVAALCFFPPWQLNGVVFWLVTLAYPVVWFGFHRRWPLFPILVGAVIVMPFAGTAAAIALGLFGSLFLMMHLALLFPKYVPGAGVTRHSI